MQKIKIRLPAIAVNFGPGLHSLGLALSLYTSIEISPRRDEQIVVEPQGEGAGTYPIGLRHPVVLAMARVFQRLENTILGFNVKIDNQIPIGSGLGAETAFLLAGVIGANNLMGSVYKRDGVMEVAAQISRADSAVTAMLGGFTTSTLNGDRLIYRTLPVHPQRVVIVLPMLERYARPAPLQRVAYPAALHNLSRVPLLMEALRTGDLDLLAQSLSDYLVLPRIVPQISGFGAAVEAARATGAKAITVIGDGPAMMIFCEDKHANVADAATNAFYRSGVTARTWVVPIDTQGVVLSVMGTR